MDDARKIIWLASYPKSGNTWFRAFLSALLNPGKGEININNLHPTIIANSRQLFDESIGIPTADLKSEEIDHLRIRVYRQYALDSIEPIYCKIHNSWKTLIDGTHMFPNDVTKAVLYFIRNPLDIAVSFGHHLASSIDNTISIMNNPNFAFSDSIDRLPNQIKQHLDTWSGHVISWVDHSHLPLLVLRYEDMKNEPVKTFSKAVSFIGLNATRKEIETALELSSFEHLKQQEVDKGFSEKSYRAKSFFRRGEIGDWQKVLKRDQVNRIIEVHGETMFKFGYL